MLSSTPLSISRARASNSPIIILSSDEMRFGGFRNVVPGGSFLTTPLEWNERKNFTQVSVSEQAGPTTEALRRHGVQVYIPSRTCVVLAKK